MLQFWTPLCSHWPPVDTFPSRTELLCSRWSKAFMGNLVYCFCLCKDIRTYFTFSLFSVWTNQSKHSVMKKLFRVYVIEQLCLNSSQGLAVIDMFTSRSDTRERMFGVKVNFKLHFSTKMLNPERQLWLNPLFSLIFSLSSCPTLPETLRLTGLPECLQSL